MTLLPSRLAFAEVYIHLIKYCIVQLLALKKKKKNHPICFFSISMRSVLREDRMSMLWRVGAGSKSHPWWKPCSVFPLFILDNSCTHTCLLLLSLLEHSPVLRNITVRAEDIILEFDGKFVGIKLATWLVTSSSLPWRTSHVAFSLGPFPSFVFPSCGLSAN